MPGLTDEQLSALEKQEAIDGGLTDEQMAHLEENHSDELPPLPPYDPMGGLTSALAGMGQAPTLGYAPEIAGKILGPKAEKSYNEALNANPALAFTGNLAGGAVFGTGLGKIVPATRAAQGLLGGAIGAAQNIPEQDSNYDAAIERLKNAGIGTALGLALGGGKERLKTSSNEAAYQALRPYKADVRKALQKGSTADIGRTALDEGIIGNVPRGTDKLLDRTDEAVQKIGAKKGALIDQVQNAADNFAEQQASKLIDNLPLDPKRIPKTGKTEYGLDVQKIRDSVKSELKVNDKLPEGAAINKQIDDLLDNFSKGEKYISIKDADKLKTELGAFVKNWYSNPNSDPIKQQFYKTLYQKLNSGVDETARFLAQKLGLPISEELNSTKKSYGNLKQIQSTLENRLMGDISNRTLSPSDQGLGAMAAIKYNEPVGLSVAALNNFLRKYGNQIRAKQYDNLVRAMDSLGVLAPTAQTVAIPGIEATSKINLRKKALEK